MQELKDALKEACRLKIPQALDSKMRKHKKLSRISKKLYGKPYNLAIVELNTGLMPGHQSLTSCEISGIFKKEAGYDISEKVVSGQLFRAIKELGVRNFIRCSVGIPGDRKEASLIPVIQKELCGLCCKNYFVPTPENLACCPECMGLQAKKAGLKRCLSCDKVFTSSGIGNELCSVCGAVNSKITETVAFTRHSQIRR